MTTKIEQRKSRMAHVPVTATDRPALSEQERAEFIDTFEAAEVRIDDDDLVDYEPEAFEQFA